MHTNAFNYTKKLFTERLLRTASFCTDKLLHKRFYTKKLLHTANFYTQQAFAQGSFYTEKLHTHTEPFLHMIMPIIATLKPDLDAKAQKSMILKAFYKTFDGKITSAKMQKIY